MSIMDGVLSIKCKVLSVVLSFEKCNENPSFCTSFFQFYNRSSFVCLIGDFTIVK